MRRQQRLEEFARGGEEQRTAALLVLDAPLVGAVQARLAHHGLLDPPADGVLGPATQWALAEFCRAAGLGYEGGLSRPAAAALLAEAPVLPLRPGGEDLAGRVARAMLRRGDWLCRHPDCVSIVYVEGMDEAGHPVPRRPDAFDDLRLLLRVAPGGRPEIAGAWEATTAPGRPAVEAPAEPLGAPRLARGQHLRAWTMGRTAIGTGLEQDALVQAAPLPVTRDADRDFRRGAGDPLQRGLFVLDQHGALDAPREAVGGAGAGCLVGRAQAGHRAFMAALRGDARWRADQAWRFTTTILGAEEVGA